MKLHRFFVEGLHNKYGKLELSHQVWINDDKLLNQLLKVLRFRVDDELILFNKNTEKIYKIIKIEFPHSALLEMVTEVSKKLPPRHVYLLWSLLKKDNNDWVIQKATELGVKNFVPVISDRSEKTGLNIERARKIIVEAVEQCGRADIPEIKEPVSLIEAINEHAGLPIFVCEQAENTNQPTDLDKLGLLIGPEGGWSDQEKAMFKEKNLPHMSLSGFTLRAETAAIVACGLIFKG